MKRLQRGQIRWYEFPEKIGKRPVLILTRNSIIKNLDKIIIAEMTKNIRGIPTQVIITKDEGMHETSVITLDNIHTVNKYKIGKMITKITREKMIEVMRAVAVSMGFDEEY